ncbi:uncharacterized protein LOC133819724 isoform X2 [Humulus lupulus]|uniref:uncharacterized protein LOC133819724 isoform X2 n=1 Tax=Humulus lupulus TaxID=3486 RepID=UPI002B40061E|nr:uncharacterized protein LOC133819724 isoform X2 [Humulus lupulus]
MQKQAVTVEPPYCHVEKPSETWHVSIGDWNRLLLTQSRKMPRAQASPAVLSLVTPNFAFFRNLRLSLSKPSQKKPISLSSMARTGGRESQGKKRKRERENQKKHEEEVVQRKDPLEVFGTDIMSTVLSYLDAHSLAPSLLVSRAWNGVASSDRLWASKARITKYDLCDHVWEVHFNKAAPEYWRNLDPYWKGGGPLLRRYFHLDGSQTADPGDPTWGGHESCYCTVTSYLGEEQIRDHYVRINRWPRMNVYRKQDWSWKMSNHLYCYSSIPDPHKQGGTGPPFSVV